VKLSLADKLALIYTSAGSQRKVAAFVGLSHQQVGRILKAREEGRSLDAYEKRYDVQASVDTALEIHTDLVRGVAKRHGLPFNAALPIYAERLPLKHKGVFVNGELVFKASPEKIAEYLEENGDELRASGKVQVKTLLGERVGALNLHWLSDKIRNAWITSNAKSGKYYSASVGSLVDLRKYNKQSNENQKTTGRPRNRKKLEAKDQIARALREGIDRQRVFTPYQPMDPRFPGSIVAQSIEQQLQTRHAPATGAPGTAYADQVLLQLDTRKSKDGDTRKAGAAKPGKARGTAKSRNRSNRR
jgi:hypothetical protein